MRPERASQPGGWEFDVAVVGGGPGGSSAATALARAGRRVLLLEREQFPRFHIGESQLPWSNEVFQALGVRETIAAAGFVRKWGASFWTIDGAAEQYADFASAVETPSPQTFQVPRARFDDLLLRHSEKCGVAVREQHRVLDATFDATGVALRYLDPESAEHTVRVGAVVDASGRAGFLAKKLGRHAFDPLLRNIAVHAQYEDVPRLSGRRAGDIRMFTRADMGWLWLIPLSDTLMSVGAVIPQAVHRRNRRPRPRRASRTTSTARRARARSWPPRAVSPRRASTRTTRISEPSWPATGGWRWATPPRSSTRSSRPASCWQCRAGWTPRAPSTTGSGRATSPDAASPPTSASCGRATTTSADSR